MKHVVDDTWPGVNMTSLLTSPNISSSWVSYSDDLQLSTSGFRSSLSPPVGRVPCECLFFFFFFFRGHPGRLPASTADWKPRRSLSQPIASPGGMTARRRWSATWGSLQQFSASVRYSVAARYTRWSGLTGRDSHSRMTFRWMWLRPVPAVTVMRAFSSASVCNIGWSTNNSSATRWWKTNDLFGG